MRSNHIFPYDDIEKDSKIIIYGLGYFGDLFIEQINRTGYCTIVAVSDRKDNKDTKGYRFANPDRIVDMEYDKVVISISNIEIASDAYWTLRSYGIKKESLCSPFMTDSVFFPVYRPESEEVADTERIRAAVTLAGGIGDYVVFLSFIRKLIEVVPDICIDIYGRVEVVKSLYPKIRNVREIYDYDDGIVNTDKKHRKYDVAFKLIHFVQVEYCDFSTVKALSEELYHKIKRTISDPVIKDMRYSSVRYLWIYDRARLLGYDRYRFLGQGSIWDISQEDSRLELDTESEKEFVDLELGKYITFNYGAAEIQDFAGKRQTKVWPAGYYKTLLHEIKKKYPSISIVQLGDDRCPVFEEADCAILNADLKLVKHVLANSLIHIDGEGGLVHIATQLGAKCIVLFGPTPVWYYGYPGNTNIVSKRCNNCCHIMDDWYINCLLGDLQPRCMHSIEPREVFACVDDYLKKEGEKTI